MNTFGDMAVLVIGSVLLGLVVAWILTRPFRSPLRHIPGPRHYPVIGSMLSINIKKYHENLLNFYKTYGPVVRVVFPHEEMVVLSGYNEIKKALVTSGMTFGGRSASFRFHYIFKHTGVLLNPPDATWKTLKTISQQHIQQFGNGLSKIEEMAVASGSSMFQIFRAYNNAAFDPHRDIFDAVLINFGYLITDTLYKPGDVFIQQMKKLEWSVFEYLGIPCKAKYVIYDFLPWMRHFKLSSWKDIEGLDILIDEIWSRILDSSPKSSFANILKANADSKMESSAAGKESSAAGKELARISETDAKLTIVMLLFGGAAPTSASFYACLNILAHKQDAQQKIYDELRMVCGKRPVTLEDRGMMPFTQAFLFEVLRYTSVVAVGFPHVSLVDSNISGIFIPRNTAIQINLWGLHHDPDFWKNPAEFDPQRFLDEDGHIFPADHPNRQHLMPLGAGPRVCPGESMAMARLFLWIAMVVQQFYITPADDNVPENIKPSKFFLHAITRVPRYKVKCQPRELALD